MGDPSGWRPIHDLVRLSLGALSGAFADGQKGRLSSRPIVVWCRCLICD